MSISTIDLKKFEVSCSFLFDSLRSVDVLGGLGGASGTTVYLCACVFCENACVFYLCLYVCVDMKLSMSGRCEGRKAEMPPGGSVMCVHAMFLQNENGTTSEVRMAWASK